MLFLKKVLWYGVILLSISTASFQLGNKTGIAEGKSQALKINPPSDELEMVCAGLWVGEQNKKYVEKDRARKH